MKLNKRVVLGVKAVSALNGQQGPLSSTVIAERIGTTSNFAEQVMRKLREAGLVTVKRGPGGGYMLNPQRESVNAAQVAEAVGNGVLFTQAEDSSGRLNNAIARAFLETKL